MVAQERNDAVVRLLVHVEGETEEVFVNELLRPHLTRRGFERVSARLLGNARQRDRRGGIRPWSAARRDIIRHLDGDAGCVATTMVDYYGLPRHGERAWPGRAAATTLPVPAKPLHVQAALAADLAPDIDTRRFVPFVVMHEFEGLLFSDCGVFAGSIGKPALAGRLQEIRDDFETPEHINDSPDTAPSKRVEALIPDYQKPLFGNVAASAIGLAKIAAECSHLQAWLSALEALARY